MKFGKKPFVASPRDYSFPAARKSLTAAGVYPITLPSEFGHELYYHTGEWGELGNTEVGNCVVAGFAHEDMVAHPQGGGTVQFSAANTITNYAQWSGYNPQVPGSDIGLVVRDALSRRKEEGVIDATGARHKIVAYLNIPVAGQPAVVIKQQILEALYLFGAVGIGFHVMGNAMFDFASGQPWTAAHSNSGDYLGGHYVPIVGYRNGMLVCVTWGKLQLAEFDFFTHNFDEAWTSLSTASLVNGRTQNGIDLGQLLDSIQFASALHRILDMFDFLGYPPERVVTTGEWFNMLSAVRSFDHNHATDHHRLVYGFRTRVGATDANSYTVLEIAKNMEAYAVSKSEDSP